MKYIPLFLLSILLLASCARIPEPIGYPYTKQQKMQAAHHWDVLAQDLSNRINNELIRSDFLDMPVFVKETCGDDAMPCQANSTSTFNEGFRDLLITQLVNYGIPTNTDSTDDAITINYKVQLIHHRGTRIRTIYPGMITALSTTVMVVRNFPSDMLSLALGGAVDFVNSTYSQKTDFEVIITTSMVFQKKYFFRSSDIYYINKADYSQFSSQSKTATAIELTTARPHLQEK